MQHYQVTATYTNGMVVRRIVVADSAVTAIQRFVTVCTNFGITLPEPVAAQGTGFEAMSADELREYAETVQAEYDADELSGPSGRQIVRDAWQRVAKAQGIDVEPVATPNGYWVDAAYQEALALMEQHNVYLHMVTREATSANLEDAGLIDDEMTAEDFYKFRHDLATDDTGMNEPEWVVQVYESR